MKKPSPAQIEKLAYEIKDFLIRLLIRQRIDHFLCFPVLLLPYVFTRKHISSGIFHLFVPAAFGHTLIP